jgi:hypothetical protein
VITGTVFIDLSEVDTGMAQFQRADRYLLDVLSAVPDGARVVVNVGDRRYVSQDAAVWLHDHDHRLEIEIQGTDPRTVARFIRAARCGGDWQAAG